MTVRPVHVLLLALIVAANTARAQAPTPARYAATEAETQLVRRTALDYLEGFMKARPRSSFVASARLS